MIVIKRFLATTAIVGCLSGLGAVSANAAGGVCGSVTALGSATANNFVTTLGNNCTFSIAQPSISNLANIAGGTVVGNTGTTSATPTATTAPVLGIPGTSAGTVGLADSAGGTFTLGAATSATTSWELYAPPAAPTSNGQVMAVSTGGVGSWITPNSTSFTITAEATSWTVTSASDGTRFNNTGASGTVIGTLPTSPSAGDNWCFVQTAAGTDYMEVKGATGETINYGGVISASAGNITSGQQGAVACVYFDTSTTAYVWSSTGPWTVT
jgi:hypothetical protein